MNLKKQITTLRGETYPMSYPSETDIELVKKEKGITEVLMTDLPRETVENVLINCLTNYAVKDKKEVFLVQSAALWVNSHEETKELITEKIKNFLGNKVLPQSTLRTEKDGDAEAEKKVGLYASWVMAQVYNELGIEQED